MSRYRAVEVLSAGGVKTTEYFYSMASLAAASACTARAAEAVFELDYELEVVDPEDLPPGTYVLLWEDKMGRESFKVLEIL